MSYVEKWLETDPSLQKFNKLVKRGKMAPSTRRNYVKHVCALVKHLGAETPEQALEILRKHENPTQLLEDFVDSSLDRLTQSSVSIMMRAGIKKWLELNNNVPIDWNYIKREVEPRSVRVVSDRAPTRKELSEIASFCILRDRAVISVAMSSGLRVGAIASLTFGDVSLEDEIPKVVVRRQDGRKISKDMPDGFGTFITPEAKRLLLEYKKQREIKGEQITESSPLFVSNRIDREGEQGRALTSNYISSQWRRILRRAFKSEKSHTWYKLHFHTLRKFFRTQCDVAGVEEPFRMFWLGHVGKDLATSYFRPEDTEHLDQYKKVLPLVTLEGSALEDKIKEIEEKYKEKLEKLKGEFAKEPRWAKELRERQDIIMKLWNEKFPNAKEQIRESTAQVVKDI